MRWKWKLGRIAGIDLYMHATFALLLGWLLVSDLLHGKPLAIAMRTTLLVLCVFACVVLHELSHALTARRFGCQTRDITLLPIGGVASLERMPDKPAQEIAVALAGPSLNLVIASVLYVVWLAVPIGFVHELMWINVSLAVFNLIPAYPMDGGRVLRAALAHYYGTDQATVWAARVGKWLAVGFGVVGFLWNPILVLIAFFIWTGADAESRGVQVRAAVHDVKVEQAMRTGLRILAPLDPLARAVELLESGTQDDFPVVDERGHCIGLVGRNEALAALALHGPEVRVGNIMKPPIIVAPSETLQAAIERFGARGDALVVEREGHTVGMVTTESVAHWLMVHGALGSRGGLLRTSFPGT